MKIPHTSLSPEILRQVIEEYVTREGTEYGYSDVDLDTKVQQVLTQLERGEASVTFDPDSETCTLVSDHG